MPLDQQSEVRRHLNRCVECTVAYQAARGRLLARSVPRREAPASRLRASRPAAAAAAAYRPPTVAGNVGVAIAMVFVAAGVALAVGIGAIGVTLAINERPSQSSSVAYYGGGSSFDSGYGNYGTAIDATPVSYGSSGGGYRVLPSPQRASGLEVAYGGDLAKIVENAARAENAARRTRRVAGDVGQLVADVSVAAPIGDDRVKVFPITADASASPGAGADVLTLDEAISDGELDVYRSSWRGLGSKKGPSKPVIALSGEVVRGGGQDQIIVRNTLVQPEQRGVFLPTTCCEPDRLDSCVGCKFHSAGPMGPPSIRAAARLSGGGSIEQNVRGYHQKVGSRVPTLALADGVKVRSVAAHEVALSWDALQENVPEGKTLRGMAAVVDGEIVALDIFDDASLAERLGPKLLQSYAAGAASMVHRDSGARALLSGPSIGAPGERALSVPGTEGFGIRNSIDLATAVDRVVETIQKQRFTESGKGQAMTFGDDNARNGSLVGDVATHRGKVVHAGFVARDY